MRCLFKKVFAIEGNIGAGKSTLLNVLDNKIDNCVVIQEPVLDWKNVGGEDLLACFYKEPKRWTFTFELYSMFSKIKRLREALRDEAEIIFMERSIYSDKAFHHISYYLDKMDTKEASILQTLYDEFKEAYPKLNGVIYVDTKPEECWRRIKARGRKEEQGITIEYLNKLQEQFIQTNYETRMVMIDGIYDLKKPYKIIDSIKKFVDTN